MKILPKYVIRLEDNTFGYEHQGYDGNYFGFSDLKYMWFWTGYGNSYSYQSSGGNGVYPHDSWLDNDYSLKEHLFPAHLLQGV